MFNDDFLLITDAVVWKCPLCSHYITSKEKPNKCPCCGWFKGRSEEPLIYTCPKTDTQTRLPL